MPEQRRYADLQAIKGLGAKYRVAIDVLHLDKDLAHQAQDREGLALRVE